MHITVDVNLNAPALSNALTALAGAISGVQHVPVVQAAVQTAVEATVETDKSKFTVKMEDIKKETTAADPAPVADPKPVDDTPPATNTEVAAPMVTLEQVRAKLGALSQAGKQAQVKALIEKFEAKKLTDIPKEKYPELLKEAEALV